MRDTQKTLASIYHLIDNGFMRQKLKDEAIQIVRRSGTQSLNYRDLGSLVGVKSSSVHYYFPTKSDLLEEIVTDYTKAFMTELGHRDEKSKSLQKSLGALLSLFSDASSEDLICLCGALASEANSLEAKVLIAVQNFFSTLEDWVERKAKGSPTSISLTPERFSRLFVSLLEGALIIDRAQKTNQRLEAVGLWIKSI
jgi:TetR/AcrR family transcriptional regulator, transcriptional repressor for nem operon